MINRTPTATKTAINSINPMIALTEVGGALVARSRFRFAQP